MTEEQALAPLLIAAQRDLSSLGAAAVKVASNATCEEVDDLFRRSDSLSTVAVTGPGGRLGLVSRSLLSQVLAGRLGYGRVLNGRRPVGEMASWTPLIFGPGVGIVAAAAQIVTRETDQWEDVLVETSAELRVVCAASVLQGMTGAFAARATHDAMTSLPNRLLFLARLARACLEPAGAGAVAVVYLDLDNFKAVNDRRGHDGGDAVLVAAALALRRVARNGDLLARLGGDEFAVMFRLPVDVRNTAERASAVAERYREALAEVPGGAFASVGVAVSQPGLADAELLVREADMAMYTAKAAGGNRVVVVDQVGEHFTLSRKGVLEADPDSMTRQAIQSALQCGQFTLHYQPIVRLSDNVVVSVEALVRWQHPTRGLLLPGAFLADAIRLGLAADVDAWVLDRALADSHDWASRDLPGFPPCVDVNISRASLARDDLFDVVTTTLQRHGVNAGRLRLELVEDAATDLLAAAAPQLAALRDHGVSLTWDDMGTGASSLKHVTQLEVDGLKIDQSFVRDMNTSSSALAVVRMLVHLADGLGITVTAEGIETAEQLITLTRLGAGHGQGYHLARPASLEDLGDVLRRWPHHSSALSAE
jgi:diguanylate cyclase (GGDEF)-like protein